VRVADGLFLGDLFCANLKFAATESAGVPVNNYIDQSQEFTLCMFATAPLLLMLLERKRWIAALG
jgi:O-antigen ligase